ncbi:MAG: DUF423 domain-containing protein [Planctomycetes bacterium]|nr:DUF423 domain-containing protein [Planctomycetota bacterium]
MNRDLTLRIAAVLGGIAVAAGAFGAHALKSTLNAADLAIWETAVRYQAWHALALLGIACLPRDLPRAGVAALCMALGAIVFSGSLYALVLLDQRWLGAVTPLGGTAMIVGWVLLATARRPVPGS